MQPGEKIKYLQIIFYNSYTVLKCDVILLESNILSYLGRECLFYYHQIINLPGKEIHTGETGKQVSIVHLSVVVPPRARAELGKLTM